MSDAAERPAGERTDSDAWATACEEDLAAEQARRREQYGSQPVSAAEELRRLADAVSEKISEIGKPFAGSAGTAAAQGVAQQFIAQAKSAIEPVVERNPDFFGHLAAAGNELLAAYQSAVRDSENRWTSGGPSRTHAESRTEDGPRTDGGSRESGDPRTSGSSPGDRERGESGPPSAERVDIERIDLDKDTGEDPGNDSGTGSGEGPGRG